MDFIKQEEKEQEHKQEHKQEDKEREEEEEEEEGEQEKIICSICLEVLEIDIKYLGCKHCFHDTCISDWLKLKASCPLCRTPDTNVPLPPIFMHGNDIEFIDESQNVFLGSFPDHHHSILMVPIETDIERMQISWNEGHSKIYNWMRSLDVQTALE